MVRSTVMRASALGVLWLSTVVSAAPDVALADAAQRNDKATVLALLKRAADVNGAQGDGMTALHWAVVNDDAGLVTALLHAGANTRATTRLGPYTPLMLAARHGNAAVIRPLLDGGADVNVRTANGTTPLMFAAASGNAAVVEALIEHDADIDATESTRGLTAAMFAAAANRAEVIRVLATHHADLAASTKLLDLVNLDRSLFAGVLFGNPAPPKTTGGAAGSVEPDRNLPAAGAAAQRVAGVDRDYQGNELVHSQGGMTPLLFAARQGYTETAVTLLDAGVDVNQANPGDRTTALLSATINGHFDLAKLLLDRGADPNLAALNGAAPLYSTINLEWAPRAGRPQPRAHLDQSLTYLEFMEVLLAKGADPNARLKTRVWYSGGLSGVDEIGATPFWRAAYASDIDAMKLLVKWGADPNIGTIKGAGRPRNEDGELRAYSETSTTAPVPIGGPAVPPLVAAAGVGYGEGFAANTHHYAPTGMMAAVKYLVEELGADVNATDHEGNTALHDAAARGDVEMINYLVGKGANVMAVNREGKSTADMANGPVQRIQPFPEALALLEKLGAKNNHRCVSC
jgi:uncharacterized protein